MIRLTDTVGVFQIENWAQTKMMRFEATAFDHLAI